MHVMVQTLLQTKHSIYVGRMAEEQTITPRSFELLHLQELGQQLT